MCGISGIINKLNIPVKETEVKNINDLIRHRGPDNEGYYFGDNFAFGHRRLSIVDLSKDGHQPMRFHNKYTITYNGEVYNYIEIKEELLAVGYTFESQTDTEVILAAYDKWGEECVEKFNGMWSFAIYDKEKNIIFCSRDRFGIKPFYFTEIDNKFVFGSEIKQLLEFYHDIYVNKKILMDYLVLGYEEHTNETFFDNIFQLEQSHNLIYDLSTHQYESKRYYDIKRDENTATLGIEDAVRLYKHTLEQAVRLRLRSDVKVGTCLSGGLDSSSISAVASGEYHKKYDKRFIAIHAKSSEVEKDESSFAKMVAGNSGLDLTIIEPSQNDFHANINEVVYTQEEPFGSPSIFMQYFVMKQAKENNCTVMLDGQGGDETLLGYERYYPSFLIGLRFYDMLKNFFLICENSKLSFKQLVLYYIYFTKSRIRLKRLKNRYSFVKDHYKDLISVDIVDQSSRDYSDIFNLQYGEIYHTQMPHLLRYEDKNSMRHSVETRLPFIDFNVVEIAISINNSFKIRNGWTKYILRKSVESILPKEIAWRKNKLGFEAPTKSWLNGMEEEIEKYIGDSKIIKEISSSAIDLNSIDEKQKWKLFNIAKWEEVYNVKIN